MKLQWKFGEWFAISSNGDDNNFEQLVKKLSPIPGVCLLTSISRDVIAIDIHRSHLPLLPPEVRDLCPPTSRGLKYTREILLSHDLGSRGVLPSLNPKFSLRDYQKRAIKFARERQGVLFLHGLGLGKTVMALCSCRSPSMVVVPTSAIDVWKIEAEELGLSTQVLQGKASQVSLVDREIDLYITTYGSIAAWAPFFKKIGGGPEIDTLIVDEAHYAHRRGLNWVKAIESFHRENTIGMTATPARNGLQSLYGILSILQGTPRPWGYLNQFRQRYCGAFMTDYGLKDGNPTNTDELADRLNEIAVFEDYSTSDLEHLRPNIVRNTIKVDIPLQLRAELSQDALRRSFRNGRTHAIIWLTELRRALAQYKFEYLERNDNLLNFMGHKRVIWWCWHKELASSLTDLFREKTGIPVDKVTGESSGKERTRVLTEWKYGDPSEPRILIATEAAMSAACNLVTAEAAYFVEYDWAPLSVIQAEKRHHRPGSKFNQVYSYYFYTEGSLEERMLEALVKKLDQQRVILPGTDQRDQILSILDRREDQSFDEVLADVNLKVWLR